MSIAILIKLLIERCNCTTPSLQLYLSALLSTVTRTLYLQQERDGLRLKLRVSNSVSLGPGSSGSSPNDLSDDTEVFNVEEFLNFPTNDFVTIEESKQV